MAVKIDDETIDYVSVLAKLELNDEEREQAKADMEKMLGYISKMEELDTSGVEPMVHAFELPDVFREDVVTNGDGREAALRNAPSQKNGMFRAPRTVEQY